MRFEPHQTRRARRLKVKTEKCGRNRTGFSRLAGRAAAGLACSFLFLASTAGAVTTRVVTSAADAGPNTLRETLATASAGDTIIFGLPKGSQINLTSGELVIDKSITIAGPGADRLTVQRSTAPGTAAFRIFRNDSGSNSTISGLAITNGSDVDGGGVFNRSLLLLSKCIVSGNSAGSTAALGSGGGIFNSSLMAIENCVISDNVAGYDGGGISNRSSMTVTASSVSGNSAYNGGGVYQQTLGTLNILNSTIDRNSASANGGGVNLGTGLTTVINSTISANTAGDSGGGIYDFDNLTIRNSTVTGNIANSGSGGGIYNNAGSLTAKNNIVALNAAPTGADCAGVVTSQGYNIIGNGAGATIPPATGDQIGVSAAQLNLGPLQDNGGATLTHALLAGSVALDKGQRTDSLTDQRGKTRPIDSPTLANAPGGDGSDIGAYEVQTDSLAGCSDINLIVTNNGDNGPGSLRYIMSQACGASTITFAPGLTSPIILTSGELVANKNVTITGPGARALTISGNDTSRILSVNLGVDATVTGLTLAHGNSVGVGSGGAIYTKGTLTLTQCSVVDNAGGSGGAVANDGGTFTAKECTFARNQSTGFGGALRNTGVLTVTNCTLTANTAFSSGAIASFVESGPPAMVIVFNSTISGNSATDATYGAGGGILNGAMSSTTLYNTIVADNQATNGTDLSGAFITGGHNLIGLGTGSTGLMDEGPEGDHVGSVTRPIDAELDVLKNNGGPTDTVALLPTSLAFDSGDDQNAPPMDQRGRLRFRTSDIGAFELFGTPPVALANISTRLSIQTGDQVLIGGFIITGNQPKQVVVRGIGPSLLLFDTLDDPRLDLYDSTGKLIVGNDNWRTTTGADILGESGLAPFNDAEAALLISLDPGAYTAIASGADGGTGNGLLEVFDFERGSDSKLANISTRGFVQTGDDVMIGGFFVVGTDSQDVVIRALGPSLPLSGTLPDPTLEVYDQYGNLEQANNDWRSDQQADISASGFAPDNDREAALLATLIPGAYTAIVRGQNDATGIALIEIYDLN